MKIEYARGANAKVFFTEPQQRLWFPRADLVREHTTRDPYWGERLFLRHRIASLLFPHNFISVVGMQTERFVCGDVSVHVFADGQQSLIFKKRPYKILSELANVPEEHAIYASHITYGRNRKDSTCGCPACVVHRDVHALLSFGKKCMKVAQKINEYGILVPFDDDVNFCQDRETGTVVFFEIDAMRYDRTIERLEQIRAKSPKETMALHLAQRAKFLLKRSEQEGYVSDDEYKGV